MATQTSALYLAGMTLTTTEAPFEFYWADEFAYTNVLTRKAVTIDGYSTVQQADVSKVVRPMTFEGHLFYSMVQTLTALSNVVGATYTCTFRNVGYTVQFDSEGGPAVQFQPIAPVTDPSTDMLYRGMIRLMIIR